MGVVEVSHRPRLISAATAGLLALGLLLLGPLLTPSPALAAITFVSPPATPVSADDDSLTISRPANAQEGDLLLAHIFFKDEDMEVDEAPAGWQLVRRTENDVAQVVYYKFVGPLASEPTSYTWEFNDDDNVAGSILAYRGVDPTSPIVASSGGGGDSQNPTAPQITAVANTKLVALFGISKNDITLTLGTTAPSNDMDLRYSFVPQNHDASILGADQDVGAGLTGSRQARSSQQDKWIGQLVGLRSAPEPELDPLVVSKTASTSLTRTYAWRIEKSADREELLLAENEPITVNYEVEVALDGDPVDSDWAVNGTITIENSTDVAATIDSVTDTISDIDGEIEVDCGDDVEFPYVLAGDDTLECTYSTDLDDAEDRVNTVTVETSSGPAGGEATADILFAGAELNEVDECIDVSDDNVGQGGLGIVCADDSLPRTFEYSLVFGGEDEPDVPLSCGETEHVNTASFETNDMKAEDESSWTVTATVDCGEGCTLSQGYWKTHSEHGPAPHDVTWDGLENETFFLADPRTYYEVLWTPPAGGNAYYILARQYIAAKLNQKNADIPTDVLTAFSSATTLFTTPGHTPAAIGLLRGNNSTRQQFISLAGILGAYNEGQTGPGSCDVDDTVVQD